jgi:hypothetical protein
MWLVSKTHNHTVPYKERIMSKDKRSGGKFSGNHTTIIPAAATVRLTITLDAASESEVCQLNHFGGLPMKACRRTYSFTQGFDNEVRALAARCGCQVLEFKTEDFMRRAVVQLPDGQKSSDFHREMLDQLSASWVS